MAPSHEDLWKALQGVAAGDAAGAAFEFRPSVQNALAVGQLSLEEAQDWRLASKAFKTGDFWVRTFTDDTVLAVLKLEAIAKSVREARNGTTVTRADVLRFLATGIRHWRYTPKMRKSRAGDWAQSGEFQGTGGATRNITRFVGQGDAPDLDEQYALAMDMAARTYLVNGSYGNGVVMSLAPVVCAIALVRGDATIPTGTIADDAFDALSFTHTHRDAVLAERWMSTTLLAVMEGGTRSADALAAAAVRAYYDLNGEPTGRLDNAAPFVVRLLAARFDPQVDAQLAAELEALAGGVDDPAPDAAADWARRRRLGALGHQLARCARCDDKSLRFSQRALNTVALGLFCATAGRSSRDVLELVVLIGGDCDTIGSVAMQLASLRLDADDLDTAFSRFARLEDGRVDTRTDFLEAVQTTCGAMLGYARDLCKYIPTGTWPMYVTARPGGFFEMAVRFGQVGCAVRAVTDGDTLVVHVAVDTSFACSPNLRDQNVPRDATGRGGGRALPLCRLFMQRVRDRETQAGLSRNGPAWAAQAVMELAEPYRFQLYRLMRLTAGSKKVRVVLDGPWGAAQEVAAKEVATGVWSAITGKGAAASNAVLGPLRGAQCTQSQLRDAQATPARGLYGWPG